jgi:hypothetical protein
MEKKGWKTTAIIFIVLFSLLFLLICDVMYIGYKDINREDKCYNQICDMVNYDTYYYDSDLKTCYCYKNHELTKQTFMG